MVACTTQRLAHGCLALGWLLLLLLLLLTAVTRATGGAEDRAQKNPTRVLHLARAYVVHLLLATTATMCGSRWVLPTRA